MSRDLPRQAMTLLKSQVATERTEKNEFHVLVDESRRVVMSWAHSAA